jgi:threonine/homoserine/homoserine lactone efflux protein
VVLVCGLGLFSALAAVPGLLMMMSVGGAAYLAYLAWQIANAPIAGAGDAPPPVRATALGGFLLGVLNPKAYLALMALLSASVLVPDSRGLDMLLKMALCMAVILAVDIAWLAAGAGLGAMRMTPLQERAMNVTMGVTVVLAALAGFSASAPA